MNKRKVGDPKPTRRLRNFKLYQRVRVLREAFEGIELDAVGTVRRLCREDDSAWVHLDARWETDPRVHPFAADDPRGTSVRAFPEDCEPHKDPAAKSEPTSTS